MIITFLFIIFRPLLTKHFKNIQIFVNYYLLLLRIIYLLFNYISIT